MQNSLLTCSWKMLVFFPQLFLFFQSPVCPTLTVLPSLLFCPFLVFLPPSFLSKTIKVKIIDDEEYEKNKTFYIEIGDPHLVESEDAKGQEEGEPLDPL